MIVEVGHRHTGKTTFLVNLAAAESLLIVCPTFHMAKCVEQMAKDQNKVIIPPISWESYLRKTYYGNNNIKGIVFDELGLSLQSTQNLPIRAITISEEV